MKIAVVGSGGREHALLWKLDKDERVQRLYALPGNAGVSDIAERIDISVDQIDQLHQSILGIRPDLVVIGPEIPLAAGIADRLQTHNISCFGPSSGAARIESSKSFAKRLMAENGVPTADFECFDSFESLRDFVTSRPFDNGWVVKADGLAAGKGAFVCNDLEEVLDCAHQVLVEGILGKAGREVVLERRLKGRETSVLFWCDGEHCQPLPAAQDYKRVADGDRGPNTGGMGSFCPADQVTAELTEVVKSEIILPVLRALSKLGSEYRGILYAGLMLTDSGPQVIEFNCRFGDPETQVILPVWDGSLVDVMSACIDSSLSTVEVPTHADRSAVCVVMAAEGYPGSYAKNLPLSTVATNSEHLVFHAGTSDRDGELRSSGGRVLNAVGVGKDVSTAREKAYELAASLKVPGLFYREDIATIVDHDSTRSAAHSAR